MIGFNSIGAVRAGQREGHGVARTCALEAAHTSASPSGGPKSHNDVFGTKNGFHPGTEEDGEIKGGEGALSYDHRVHKFDRNMLRIGGIGAASECEQAPALEKAIRHFAAGHSEAKRFARKKFFYKPIAWQQPFFNLSCELIAVAMD